VKTADRILETARTLFNDEGESNVAASDIAIAMDISSGNLYYHFKGKDAIHRALFSRLQQELVALLATPLTNPSVFTDDEDSPLLRGWLFLTIVLETMYAYRYLYESPAYLMHRYPEIDRGFQRLSRLKHAACEALVRELLESNGPSQQRLDSAVNAMALTLTFWLSWDRMVNPDAAEDVIIHQGVLQLLSFCAPFMGAEQESFYEECEILYREMVIRGKS